MKKTKITKVLSLRIESSDKEVMLSHLKKIEEQIRSGQTNFDRSIVDSTTYEWSLETLVEADYREEMINGQWCQIYQSSMNHE